MGIDPKDLSEDDLLRELGHLYQTRMEALLHGPDDALARHTSRTNELESEFLRRHPVRDIDPGRLREGARAR
ncbi:DUF6158 family protein [Nonomuraea africana]|uniref:Uncharacterized protein n=1 Tax=Nonomuraea africana TaxID=46171 RepID=A0ABR9KIC6_9ACTN|nr:DUF6158 family protein [Nonomuraea africana]MBE1561787.1 hypothetical protein [Nonomuraea africana]